MPSQRDSPDPPIACSQTSSPGAVAERMAEYRRLFRHALLGRSRTPAGIRFRFRRDPGVQQWVSDLARREQECCPFFRFRVYARNGEVWWDAAVMDDEAARQILGRFYRLPDTLGAN